MKIEVGKTYKTRGGLPVRIYAVDGYGIYPIHGAILRDYGWEICKWTSDGKSIAYGESVIDIVLEAPPFEFDKSVLPKWARGICMTENGEWFYYNENVELFTCIDGSEEWNHGDSWEYIPSEYAPKNYTGRWQDSHYTVDQL